MLNNEKYQGFLDSPVGIIRLCASDIGLRSLDIVEDKGKSNENEHILFHKRQLEDYFSNCKEPKATQIDLSGNSEFDRSVWTALTKIPFGSTFSYKQLSIAIGNPKAVRAVGTANGRNPVLIIIPCHRVIGSDGSLTGFSAGIEIKRKLLMHENVIPQELF